MIKLNSAQEAMAKSFLLDLCIRKRFTANTRDELYAIRGNRSLLGPENATEAASATSTIMDALTRRTFNFAEVDTALDMICRYGFTFGSTIKAAKPSWKLRSVASAAKFLAWCCAQNKIYWNDMAYTPSEREAWKTHSVFAAQLFDAECFVSQPTTVARSRGTSTKAAATSVARASTGAPKSEYKAAGPQSAYVAGLVGTPGTKDTVASSVVYCITGDKSGTITPKAFIHPVENPSVGERAKVNSAGLPIVKFGAGQGYTDITIYSSDKAVMEKIFKNLEADGKSFSKYSGVHVATVKAEPKGYYRVNTEYGEVLIKPTKLNEKLFTEAFEAMAEAEAGAGDESTLDESSTPAIENMTQFIRDSKLYD